MSTKNTKKPGSSGQSRYSSQCLEQHLSKSSYKQILIGLSINYIHFWRFPYLIKMYQIGPFLIIYLLNMIIIGYPMHLLFCAIGLVTKKGPISCWDICPMGRGIAWSSLLIACSSALSISIHAAYFLAMFVQSFRWKLPWYECGSFSTSNCTNDLMTPEIGRVIPATSFIYNEILHKEGMKKGLMEVVGSLVLYSSMTWVVVYVVTKRAPLINAKILSYSAFVAYFLLVTFTIHTTINYGFPKFENEWQDFTTIQIWRMAAEEVLMELTVAQGTLITVSSAYDGGCVKLKWLSLACVGTSIVTSLLSAAIMCSPQFTTQIGPTTPIIVWATIVSRIRGSQFWSVLVFLGLFFICVVTVGVLISTVLDSIYSTIPQLKDRLWYYDIIFILSLFVMSISTLCSKGGIYMHGFMDTWPASVPRLATAAAAGLFLNFGYGIKTFCNELKSVTGGYPCIYLRACWTASPFLLLILNGFWTPPAIYGEHYSTKIIIIGWVLVIVTLLPILLTILINIVFRFRINKLMAVNKKIKEKTAEETNKKDLRSDFLPRQMNAK